MLQNPNRFLVKQVESTRRRRARDERHADRMEVQRLQAQSIVKVASPVAAEVELDDIPNERDVIEIAHELGVDLTGVVKEDDNG